MRKKKSNSSPKQPINVEPNVLAIPGLFVRGRNSKEIQSDTRVVTQSRKEGDLQIFDEVVISRTAHGFPTVTDLSLLFYLFDLYQQQGFPEQIEVSLRSMADFLGKSWGGNNRGIVLACLDRLGTASYLWKSKFQTPNDVNTSRERFTLLSYSHKERTQLFEDESRPLLEKTFIKLAPQICNNLKVGFAIPIDLETFKNLRIDLSKQIYSWACSRLRLETDILEKSCRIPSLQLFDELSIFGTRYGKKSKRKEILIPAIEEVNGQIVPQGFIRASLEENENDIEVVLGIHRPKTEVPQNSVTPVALVELFLKVFGRQNRNPSQSEVVSATDFLASYPLLAEQAEDFLKQIAAQAKKSKYHPDWFNGIKRNLIQMVQGKPLGEPARERIENVSRPNPKARKKPAGQEPRFPVFDQPPPPTECLNEEEIRTYQENHGQTLFAQLSQDEQDNLIKTTTNELMASEKKKIFKLWEAEVFEEYLMTTIFRRLAQQSP